MADLGEEAFSSQMKVVATFLRLLEELMRNKQQDLRYGTKTQRRGILGRMKDFVGGIFKKVYDGTFGRLSRNGKDYGQLDLNDPAVAKLFADTMKQMGMDAMHEDNNLLFSTSDVAKILAFSKMVEQELGKKIEHENDTPEKEQSQEHGQDQERQADVRGWSDYPATPELMMLFLFIGVSNNTSVGDLTGNEATVAKFLKEKGLDNTHVAAIMGNMYAESGIDPKSGPHKGDIAYGICRWDETNGPGRGTKLKNYASSIGKPWSDLQVQLDFFWEHDIWDTWPKETFMSTNDLKTATREFCDKWEIPAKGYERYNVRYEAAERYYKALNASENSGDGDHGNGKGAPQIKGATARQQAVVNACYSTPSPGLNWCAAWVTNVFKNAGVGYFGGNACDMFNAYCHSSDRNTLKVGMIVADSSHFGTGTPGLQYGHVGIYVGNNKVMSNEGSITTKSLQDFINFYGTGSGVKWGWIGGIDLSK